MEFLLGLTFPFNKLVCKLFDNRVVSVDVGIEDVLEVMIGVVVVVVVDEHSLGIVGHSFDDLLSDFTLSLQGLKIKMI